MFCSPCCYLLSGHRKERARAVHVVFNPAKLTHEVFSECCQHTLGAESEHMDTTSSAHGWIALLMQFPINPKTTHRNHKTRAQTQRMFSERTKTQKNAKSMQEETKQR